MTSIHPTAIVSPSANIGEDCDIGPYCIIEANVTLGRACRLISHVHISGPTEIGEENLFYPFCSIGHRSQDLKYKGEPTYLRIGSRNTFRESCTVNRATSPGLFTIVGSDNNFLAYSHIAHDCIVGNHVIFSNNGTIAGHVIVEDYAIIGGLSGVHQFCRIGQHAIIGGCTKIVQDVPPFFIADGNPAQIRGVNLVGLERAGFPDDKIRLLREAYRLLYRANLNVSQALERIRDELEQTPEISALLHFIESSQRGIIR
ncbi:MAG: acyl-ACP--UDP-N-acetylglucosamine O-acyltransferase [Chthoniobacterales bacterium]|nr:acyl-ACP--UDP-N-acetylglucosamine O-acyltransferase [Chthoniobacterales bacterium]